MKGSISKVEMNEAAKNSVINVINGNDSFTDVITLAQHQMIDEFPDFIHDKTAMAETIMMMASLN